MPTFAEQVALLTAQYQRRMRAVAKEAVQETVSVAQRVHNEGGRMRVKTGFLRASIAAALGTMPAGVSVNPDPKTDNAFRFDGDILAVQLARWDLTQTLFVGWTANYARAREYRDGFLRGATEQWQEHVRQAVIKAKAVGL